jgi:hypothetical protein
MWHARRSYDIYIDTVHMNKDALLASGIGFGVGLLITGTILMGPTLVSQVSEKISALRSASGEVASATQEHNGSDSSGNSNNSNVSFTIVSPTQEEIVTTEKVDIKGKSPSGSTIIIAGDVDEAVTTANDQNEYSASITMKEGVNMITVTSLSNDTPTVNKITLFYQP